MSNTNLAFRNTRSLFILLILTISITSCSGQVKTNEEAIKSNSSDEAISVQKKYQDPLFFIDGQLCQHVRKIFQDSKGNLWFGTNIYGMMRYDGHDLVYFEDKSGFCSGRVTGILEDAEGNVWISSHLGLYKYDGHSFKLFDAKDGLQDSELWSILIDSKGIFWVGSNEGVSIFDGRSFKTFDVPKAQVKDTNTIYSYNRMVSIVEDKKGHIWFGTDGFGLTKYDGSTFTHYTTEDGLCDHTIHDMKVDSKGNLWIGTYWGGLSLYDGKGFTNFTKDGVIEGVEVGGIYEDTDGSIWFAAENSGVYRYDGTSFTNYDEDAGLLTNGILSIYRDRENRFWFGGWGGLFRFDGSSFVSVTKDGPWGE